jgi:hypothetical protein
VARGTPSLGKRTDSLDSLIRPEALEGLSQLGAVRQAQVGVELEQWHQHEPPRGHLRVREGEALGAQLEVAEQQQVDVDRPWAVPGAAKRPAVLRLDCLAEVEQLLRLELGADPDRGVEEVGLIQDLANRLGLVQRGDRLDIDAMAPQVVDRPPQVRLAIADIRAEPEIADPQTPSSSSESRSSERSSVTSTAASWTGYGTGGSGFAALTCTDSKSKRSISRSQTTWQSRSRVR